MRTLFKFCHWCGEELSALEEMRAGEHFEHHRACKGCGEDRRYNPRTDGLDYDPTERCASVQHIVTLNDAKRAGYDLAELIKTAKPMPPLPKEERWYDDPSAPVLWEREHNDRHTAFDYKRSIQLIAYDCGEWECLEDGLLRAQGHEASSDLAMARCEAVYDALTVAV